MRPPALIKPYVRTFAREVLKSGAEPSMLYVPCTPLNSGPQHSCFPLVEQHAAQHGGQRVIGWAIWERPKVYIEAEFHAIWRDPGGRLVDIAPRGGPPIPRILFLHDLGRQYKGVQVNNVRKALTHDHDVHRFLAIADRIFDITNKGNLKYQLGEIELTPELRSYVQAKELLRQKIERRYGPLESEGFGGADR